jgi:hypothetical protein
MHSIAETAIHAGLLLVVFPSLLHLDIGYWLPPCIPSMRSMRSFAVNIPDPVLPRAIRVPGIGNKIIWLDGRHAPI